MKRFLSFFTVVVALAIGMALGFIVAKWSAPHPGISVRKRSEAHPFVQTTPIRQSSIVQTIRAYGTVVAKPGSQNNLSVAFESQVVKVLAVSGRLVQPHQALAQVQASPAELLYLARCKNMLQAAAAQLQQVQAMLKLQLATRRDVIAAQSAVNAASLRCQALRRMGVGTLVTLRATEEALVAQAPVVGQVNPAGTPLISLWPEAKVQVRVGVLPRDAARLKVGRSADIALLAARPNVRIPGSITMLSSGVNPDTGFVDVYVTPRRRDGLLIGQYVSCRLVTAASQGLIVPHAAVLPASGQEYLYTVNNGHAVLHHVRVGLSNHREVEILGGGLHAGEPVVVVGNAELSNGMTVRDSEKP